MTSLRPHRRITEKAMEQYEERLSELQRNFDKSVNEVHLVIRSKLTLSSLTEIEITFEEKCNHMYQMYNELCVFLERTKTEESLKLMDVITSKQEEIKKSVILFKDEITTLKHQDITFTVPRVSRPSSTTSSARLRAKAEKKKLLFLQIQAKLQAEKAALEERHIVEYAALNRQRKTIDIEIELVKQQKVIAEAEAEQEEEELERQSVINVHELESKPPVSPVATKDTSITGDFTKFLLKKDILLSRLTIFNEQPESYQSWKTTFKSVCEEIAANSLEEIDLLIKWLGKDTKKQATSLKTAYVANPIEGLQQIWSRLDERYGSPESVFHATVKKLENFPKITVRESTKLYDLSDILSEIKGLKQDPRYASVLSYFDSSVGVNPIVTKLPHNLQEKWMTHAAGYKDKHNVAFPPFRVLQEFVKTQSRIRNDPSFKFVDQDYRQKSESRPVPSSRVVQQPRTVDVRKTTVDDNAVCTIHKSSGHNLENCRTFVGMSYDNRRQHITDNKLYFKCFRTSHISKDCKEKVVCQKCSKNHNSLLHKDIPEQPPVTTSCTEVCGEGNFSGRSCSKVCLVRLSSQDSGKSMTAFAIIDDQSNRSLAKSVVFETLELPASKREYTMISCGGQASKFGRMANCTVESMCSDEKWELKGLTECEDIPNSRHEIPTPEVAANHQHLHDVACYLPDLHEAEICILIGRDLIDVHHVLDQRFGPKGSPYAQKLPLGWVVIGEVCVCTHKPNVITVNKTHLWPSGRESNFEPCPNVKIVQEHSNKLMTDQSLFARKQDDDEIAPSVEDRNFIKIMDETVRMENGKWSAPLPFRQNRQMLPNNYKYALSRAKSFQASLTSSSQKQEQVFEFMGKLLENGHAERAPKLNEGEECWYLPVFGVYHPRKPDQVRCVFDSSAMYQNTSLNKVLLTGP